MAFPPLGNSNHVVVSVSIDFPSNSQQDAPFHRIAYNYSCADWRIFLNLVLLLLVVNFVSGFRLELMYIFLIENISLSVTHLHGFQLLVSSDSKVNFRQASKCCKRVLEAAKLAYANETKESITSQKRGSQDFWEIANSITYKGKSTIPPLFNYNSSNQK